jgi:hypothetical protein
MAAAYPLDCRSLRPIGGPKGGGWKDDSTSPTVEDESDSPHPLNGPINGRELAPLGLQCIKGGGDPPDFAGCERCMPQIAGIHDRAQNSDVNQVTFAIPILRDGVRRRLHQKRAQK